MSDCGVCILAGGLSERMGREKARMRLGARSLLGHVRRVANELGVEVRVIRKDLVPRCGPIGGIFTGLKTSSHQAELFLSCDMPFVRAELLNTLKRSRLTMFVEHDGMVGFPLIIPVTALETVEREIQMGRISLRSLARRLKAKRLRVKGAEARQLLNVNTPEDWEEARRYRAELPL